MYIAVAYIDNCIHAYMYMVNVQMRTVCTTAYVMHDHVAIKLYCPMASKQNTPLAASHYDHVFRVITT